MQLLLTLESRAHHDRREHRLAHIDRRRRRTRLKLPTTKVLDQLGRRDAIIDKRQLDNGTRFATNPRKHPQANITPPARVRRQNLLRRMLHIDNHDPDRKAALAVPAMNRLRRQRYLPPRP